MQLKQQMDELTSELTIKEKSVMKLKDDNKILSKKISENKVEKVHIATYMHVAISIEKTHP